MTILKSSDASNISDIMSGSDVTDNDTKSGIGGNYLNNDSTKISSTSEVSTAKAKLNLHHMPKLNEIFTASYN